MASKWLKTSQIVFMLEPSQVIFKSFSSHFQDGLQAWLINGLKVAYL